MGYEGVDCNTLLLDKRRDDVSAPPEKAGIDAVRLRLLQHGGHLSIRNFASLAIW